MASSSTGAPLVSSNPRFVGTVGGPPLEDTQWNCHNCSTQFGLETVRAKCKGCSRGQGYNLCPKCVLEWSGHHPHNDFWIYNTRQATAAPSSSAPEKPSKPFRIPLALTDNQWSNPAFGPFRPRPAAVPVGRANALLLEKYEQYRAYWSAREEAKMVTTNVLLVNSRFPTEDGARVIPKEVMGEIIGQAYGTHEPIRNPIGGPANPDEVRMGSTRIACMINEDMTLYLSLPYGQGGKHVWYSAMYRILNPGERATGAHVSRSRTHAPNEFDPISVAEYNAMAREAFCMERVVERGMDAYQHQLTGSTLVINTDKHRTILIKGLYIENKSGRNSIDMEVFMLDLSTRKGCVCNPFIVTEAGFISPDFPPGQLADRTASFRNTLIQSAVFDPAFLQ